MVASTQQRRFNSHLGSARSVAESDDVRMQREARHGEAVKQRLICEAQRIPVTNAEPPQLPKDFVAECMAMIEIHIANGHFEQAAETALKCKDRWELRQLFGTEYVPSAPSDGFNACHVNLIFDSRTANLIETLCNGTIGALLEIFPAKFVGCPNAGSLTVKNIARHLVRIGAIDADDAQKRIEQYDNEMLSRK